MKLMSVPRQVLILRKLRVLNLRGNNLSMLPTELCECFHDLEYLNLASNRLQYIPENISSLTKLRTLLVQNNELVELPDGVGRLPLLLELRIETNLLEALPESMGRLSLLKVLTLSNNRLSVLPGSMVAMRSLESLDVSGNPDLDLDSLPDTLYRLNEMYALLHSKQVRTKIINRAGLFVREFGKTFRKTLLETTSSMLL
eukprot:CAMPEP_0114344122 /NCGR_PEP_ID=MMETSP0101-20121206/11170_1 /TAXON_ID=38822 ORGANISM="Pteridomonas danica, Strain PT" /NCGR_SAMPLE_ID=MMETSP0101 /ASSEMBLY_ACC=CAM_ASM_000211 /LENGTH=199 /DNA_ID=CAMNT_0001479287 /DNA_START=75 /DNA_END=674 /DNA_ORIENTATION=+